MSELTLLKDLTLLPGVSGHEDSVREYMMRELQTIASDVYSDKLGSIVFEFYANTQEEEKPVNVLLVGHMDEIGFMVHSIRKNGLINFTNLGGWDPRTLMSSPVEIVNRDGKKSHRCHSLCPCPSSCRGELKPHTVRSIYRHRCRI
jgi:endoglucanase